MTPVTACLRKVDHASVVTDSTVVDDVWKALNELEDAFTRPSERIVALEEVLQEVSRRSFGGKPYGRFVRVCVERRQLHLSRRSKMTVR